MSHLRTVLVLVLLLLAADHVHGLTSHLLLALAADLLLQLLRQASVPARRLRSHLRSRLREVARRRRR